MSKQKSLILVTVDCLRADHVGFMGYERATTPFLDSLAAESFVFPAAIAAGAPTYYSFPAILASRYPLAMGRDLLGLALEEPTLASVLQQAGYATAAFGSANPYISNRFGYDHGFDVFRDFLGGKLSALTDNFPVTATASGWAGKLNQTLARVSHGLGPIGAVYDELYFQYCQRLGTPAAASLDVLRRFPAADVLVDDARAWLASVGERPFFLWLHLMDPHSPYYPTEKALELMGNNTVTPFRARYLNSCWNRSDLAPSQLARYRDDTMALYDAGVRWVDAQMARLVETLNHFHLWENCIFAFTADHGEEFLDHGGRYHRPSNLMEELIHVPLLVRVPGMRKVEPSKCPFSLLHLAPTLLDAINIPSPSSFRGRSYWSAVQQGASWLEAAISESVLGCTNPFRPENRLGPRVLVVRETKYKVILHFEPTAERLFDLEADPLERSPLPPHAEKIVRRRLLDLARAHVNSSIKERDPGARLRAHLRDLRLQWT